MKNPFIRLITDDKKYIIIPKDSIKYVLEKDDDNSTLYFKENVGPVDVIHCTRDILEWLNEDN